MTFPYEDILSHPRPLSRRSRITGADRAAQFSSFAALNGHEEALAETARITDTRAELDENEKALLNEKLQSLSQRLSEHPMVSVTYFAEDGQKQGGAYVTVTGRVKKIDLTGQQLVLDGGGHYSFGDVYAVI